jgi:hypothetical protein
MGQILYDLILDQMGPMLKVSKRDLELDIKSITNYWETSLERAQVADRDTAIFLLTTCATCYLSGRDVRMDNPVTLKENHKILVALVTLITLYAWKQASGPFPKIKELLPVEIKKGGCLGGDIVAQAEQILREKSIHPE